MHMILESPGIMRKYIILILIVSFTIALSEFITRSQIQKDVIQKVIYKAKEDTTLQCAHRCQRVSKAAVTMFDEKSRTCSCAELEKEKSEGGDGPVILKKHIKREFINVALNKPAWQSSTADNRGRSNLATKANDGNLQTRSKTNVTSLLNPYWTVDLKETFQVSLIKIFLGDYALYTKDWYGDITILTKETDRNEWIECETFPSPQVLELETTCEGSTSQPRARFIKIINSKNKMFVLHEVEVYAKQA